LYPPSIGTTRATLSEATAVSGRLAIARTSEFLTTAASLAAAGGAFVGRGATHEAASTSTNGMTSGRSARRGTVERLSQALLDR